MNDPISIRIFVANCCCKKVTDLQKPILLLLVDALISGIQFLIQHSNQKHSHTARVQRQARREKEEAHILNH